MDRTSLTGVIACIALLISWEYYCTLKWPQPIKPAVASSEISQSTTTNLTAANASPFTLQQKNSPLAQEQKQFETVANPQEEKTAVLENADIRAVFTTNGGAIKEVELKKHIREGTEKIILNHDSPEGILNLSGWDHDQAIVSYTMTATPAAVTFHRQLSNGAAMDRLYRLMGDYQIQLNQTISNPTHASLQLSNYHLNVGMEEPVYSNYEVIGGPERRKYQASNYVGAAWYQLNNSAFRKMTVQDFNPSGILGFHFREARSLISSGEAQLGWAAVKSQFFTIILTAPADAPFQEMIAQPVILSDEPVNSGVAPKGIEAAVSVAGFNLAPGTSKTEEFSVYAGPKENARLAKLGHNENLIMDFGMFGWIVRPLLSFMRGLHFVVPNWGLCIILMTLIIKGALWPLQSIANKSMKQMQALQPKMKELQEKYKDDPTKLNTEMMGLYREFGVNPVGGCLPLLVQMPIFIGFYVMLQNVIELRGASFLWVHDLTRPDTVAHLAGYDVNLLPIIMTATSFLLMRMNPQASENPQMKVMQFMPLVLMVVLYNFAAALALYWTMNNLISMAQTYINLRKPIPTLKRVPKKKPMLVG